MTNNYRSATWLDTSMAIPRMACYADRELRLCILCGSTWNIVRIMKMQKDILFSLAIPVAILVLVCLWVALFADHGGEFGYYEHFNRVKHVMEEMPNVTIIDHWQHKDISLEDFGFTLIIEGKRQVEVDFTENSPQMKMRSKSKIREFIQEKIDSRN